MNILNWFQPINKIGFDDILQYMNNKKKGESSKIILINTLPLTDQEYLILHTIHCHNEETLMNDILKKNEQPYYTIIIYGKNVLDETTKIKYKQMNNLGFHSVYIYYGGLFEWGLLGELYGIDTFPTTTKCRDLLHFSPKKVLPNSHKQLL